MQNNYGFYIVDAVCGHVGVGNYVIKSFCVEAKNAKDAAAKGRRIPRVKHHYKYAIQNVREVTFEKFLVQKLKNAFDPFFQVSNSTEQRMYCDDLEILPLDNLDGTKFSRGKAKVGYKKYVNNYMPDCSDLEEYKYISMEAI